MSKPKPVVDPKVCDPKKCGEGICVALAVCSMHILQQEEAGEPPYPVADCKGCNKCSIACPLEAIKMV
jgi:MinD superfamily P-loop ATPase